MVNASNIVFTQNDLLKANKVLTSAVNTVEAWIHMSTNITDDTRGGVIVGNYNDTKGYTNCFSFEIHKSGNPRIYFRYNCTSTSEAVSEIIFNYNVRTSKDTHLAVTINRTNNTATLYVNGAVATGCENITFTNTTSPIDNNDICNDDPIVIGNDHRGDKTNPYFKGTIYSVSLFSDVRTQAEIATDKNTLNTTDSNLLASYNLRNCNTQTTIKDLSSNGYNLTFTRGNAMSFIPDRYYSQNSAPKSMPLTIEATIKLPNNYVPRGGIILGNYGEQQWGALNFEIYDNGKPRLYICNGKNANVCNAIFETNVATGSWVHIALTINNTTVTCYVNGTSVGTHTATESLNTIKPTRLVVGGDYRYYNGSYFKGQIKNVVAYSKVKTASEIATDAKATTINTTNLVFGYNLEGQSGKETIADLSSNKNDLRLCGIWIKDDSITDPTNFDYSFAVVGDTQMMNYHFPNDFPKTYDYIINNKDSKNIKHVFGMGDITEANTDAEYERASAQFNRLEQAGIPYTIVRGNHDSKAQYEKYFGVSNKTNTAYKSYHHNQYAEYYKDTSNSIHYFSAGNLDYMSISLDYGASDAVLAWVGDRLKAHPNRNAIISTHAYWFRDNTTLDTNDVVPPTKDTNMVFDKTNINNGDDMWNELISKYPNIVLAMSGHDPCDFICMGQLKGDNGNVVTNMLIDGQYMDSKGYANLGGLGMVAMFYFSNEGKNVEVRWWSTVQNCYYRTENQFSFTINTVKAAHTEATEKIAELPSTSSITLNDVVTINSVADYYNNLAPESKSKVTNVAKLNEALAKIEALYSAKEDAYSITLKILSVSDALNATTQKEIANIWTLYNTLDDSAKAEINPYYIYLLEQKEARLGDNVMTAQRAQTLIEIIEYSADQKTATTLARQAFNDLTTDQQSFISNLAELESKLAYYENLVA